MLDTRTAPPPPHLSSGEGAKIPEGWPALPTLQGLCVAVIATVMGVAPRLTPWLIAALAVLCIVPHLRTMRALLGRTFDGSTAAATLLVPGLGLLSALWSIDDIESLQSASGGMVIAIAVLLAVAVLPLHVSEFSPTWKRRMVRAIPIGGGIGLAFLLVEAVSGQAVTRAALTAFPALIGGRGKGVRIEAGQVSELASFFANRNVASLTFVAIPLLAAATIWVTPRWRLRLLCVLLAAITIVVFASDSETAKLALVVGAVVVPATVYARRFVKWLLAAAMVVGLLLTVTLAQLPMRLGLHEAAWLPYSHRDRVFLWDYNARLAAQHPWLGQGVEASRVLQLRYIRQRDAGAVSAADRSRPAWHAHNIYLQTRVEMGIVGSFAMLVFGLAMLRAAGRLSPWLVPWGYGLVALTMASAVSGWGLWQFWFLGSLGGAVIFMALVDAAVGQRKDTWRL